ncbi:hypothetical protein [Desertibaculum subflavum]|uniref:hypothetical protein n=1 Tax=Desertibaculum subflavum TaxID=2268458 RepID=UPI0013C4EC02
MKPVSSSTAPAAFSKPVPPGIAKKEDQLPPGQLKRLDNLPKGIETRFPRPEPAAEPAPTETPVTAGALGGSLDVTV